MLELILAKIWFKQVKYKAWILERLFLINEIVKKMHRKKTLKTKILSLVEFSWKQKYGLISNNGKGAHVTE